MIDREVRHRVEEAPDLEPAVVLVGPRQVGMKTLALEIGKKRNAVYLDLEDPGDRMPLLADPNRCFASTEDRLVILDEIHRAPEIFQILRGVIDRGRRAGKRTGRFLVLGSASIDLIRQSGESLAGRVAYIDMTPFTIRKIPNGEQDLNRLWVRGGYPESWLARTDRQSFDLRLNLIRAYLDRDIPMFGPRLPTETVWRFWTMLAHRQGGLLNASGPARSLDTSPNAVGISMSCVTCSL